MAGLCQNLNQNLDALLDLYTQENLHSGDNIVQKEVTALTPNVLKNNNDKELGNLNQYKILMDTCSFLYRDGRPVEIFLGSIENGLLDAANKILIPQSVIDELVKQERNIQRPELNEPASRILKLIAEYVQKGIMEIRHDPNDDKHADAVFKKIAAMHGLKYNLLFITQDNTLAQELIGNFTNSVAVRGYHVKVRRIDPNGCLVSFPWDSSDVKQHKKGEIQKVSKNKKNHVPRIKELTSIPDATIPVASVPSEGGVVCAGDGTKYILGKPLGAGGEGTTYTVDNSPLVAKIYNDSRRTRRRFEKIKQMVDSHFSFAGLCLPSEILYNDKGEFLGYLMPKAQGYELQKLFLAKPILLSRFPDWKKHDMVQLALTILEKIQYLHDHDILIGDINPNNILVVSPQEVYLVDTDSYQIGEFPCPVGTINYTAPEIQGRDYASFMRTPGNEYFAIATLLFMIMLPGKAPYAHQGGGNPATNILQRKFPYPAGEKHGKDTPDGPWRFIWSHLPRRIKDAFWETFHEQGQHNQETSRFNTGFWIGMFTEYRRLLTEGILQQNDDMADELFPTRKKRQRGVSYIECKVCHREVEEEKSRDGMCWDCRREQQEAEKLRREQEREQERQRKALERQKREQERQRVWETRTCVNCGASFTITQGEHDFFESRGMEFPKRCSACRGNGNSSYSSPSHSSGSSGGYVSKQKTQYNQSRNQVWLQKTCVDCGMSFTITKGEYDFFNSRGMEIPKRCPSCRGRGASHSSYSSYSSSRSSKKQSFCYITTAACEYYGKPDNCEELMMLREFRDRWLYKQRNGEKLIRLYYDSAPALVERLKSSKCYESLCQWLWNDEILPCLELIRRHHFVECCRRYIGMVKKLSLMLSE